jgi:hypothetical protein
MLRISRCCWRGRSRMEERSEESRFELIKETVEETHTVVMMKDMIGCCRFLEDYDQVHRLTRRAELLPLVADIYCDPKKLTAFIGSLEPAAREIVNHLLWVEDDSLDKLIKLFDLAPPSGRWEREKYLPHPFLFRVDYREQVRLQEGFDFLFRALLPRPKIEEKCWEGTPPGEFRFEPDGSLAAGMGEMFHLLLDAGFFERKYNAPVLAGTVKRLSGWLSVPGFDWDERYPGLRWRYILPFLAFSFWDEEDEIPHEPPLNEIAEPVNLIRRMVSSYFHTGRYALDLALLLPRISVRRKELFFHDHRRHRPEYLPRIYSFFGSWRWEGWLSMESLKDLLWADNLRYPFPVNEDVSCMRLSEFGGPFSYKDSIRSRSDYRQMVFEPYIEGQAFLLASLGLFSLSWDAIPEKEMEEKVPARPRLLALRMTGLGRTVFGLPPARGEEEFRLETPDKKRDVELDERYLIARVDPSQKAAVRFFTEISDSLGSRMFKINRELLRKRCKTYRDLEEKFVSLERYAGGELPPVWEDLRRDIMGNFVRLRAETDWVVYHLPEENKPFLDWLRRSGAACFTPLPGNRVLVHKDERKGFRRLLQKGGFNPLISD